MLASKNASLLPVVQATQDVRYVTTLRLLLRGPLEFTKTLAKQVGRRKDAKLFFFIFIWGGWGGGRGHSG